MKKGRHLFFPSQEAQPPSILLRKTLGESISRSVAALNNVFLYYCIQTLICLFNDYTQRMSERVFWLRNLQQFSLSTLVSNSCQSPSGREVWTTISKLFPEKMCTITAGIQALAFITKGRIRNKNVSLFLVLFLLLLPLLPSLRGSCICIYSFTYANLARYTSEPCPAFPANPPALFAPKEGFNSSQIPLKQAKSTAVLSRRVLMSEGHET